MSWSTISDASCNSYMKIAVYGNCTNTCASASDGTCDDEDGTCEYGTDCADCGPRNTLYQPCIWTRNCAVGDAHARDCYPRVERYVTHPSDGCSEWSSINCGGSTRAPTLTYDATEQAWKFKFKSNQCTSYLIDKVGSCTPSYPPPVPPPLPFLPPVSPPPFSCADLSYRSVVPNSKKCWAVGDLAADPTSTARHAVRDNSGLLGENEYALCRKYSPSAQRCSSHSPITCYSPPPPLLPPSAPPPVACYDLSYRLDISYSGVFPEVHGTNANLADSMWCNMIPAANASNCNRFYQSRPTLGQVRFCAPHASDPDKCTGGDLLDCSASCDQLAWRTRDDSVHCVGMPKDRCSSFISKKNQFTSKNIKWCYRDPSKDLCQTEWKQCNYPPSPPPPILSLLGQGPAPPPPVLPPPSPSVPFSPFSLPLSSLRPLLCPSFPPPFLLRPHPPSLLPPLPHPLHPLSPPSPFPPRLRPRPYLARTWRGGSTRTRRPSSPSSGARRTRTSPARTCRAAWTASGTTPLLSTPRSRLDSAATRAAGGAPLPTRCPARRRAPTCRGRRTSTRRGGTKTAGRTSPSTSAPPTTRLLARRPESCASVSSTSPGMSIYVP